MSLCREHLVMIYTLGVMGELKKKGLVDGGYAQLSPDGAEMYEQMKLDGFPITEEELHGCIAYLQSDDAKDAIGGAA